MRPMMMGPYDDEICRVEDRVGEGPFGATRPAPRDSRTHSKHTTRTDATMRHDMCMQRSCLAPQHRIAALHVYACGATDEFFRR